MLLRGGWAAALGALREANPIAIPERTGDCRATAAWFGSVDDVSYGVGPAQLASGVGCYSRVAGPLDWGALREAIP